MSQDPYSIIKYPLNTEKAVKETELSNSLIFVVDAKATKTNIKWAVEKAFDVKVEKVRTIKDMKGRKKAYVQLDKNYPALDINTKLGLV